MRLFITPILFSVSIAMSVEGFMPDAACFEQTTTKRADDCCMVPKIYDYQYVAECLISVGNFTGNTEKYKCLVACIAKKLNIYKGDSLDKAAAQRVLISKTGSDSHFAPLVDRTFEQCYGHLAEIVAYEQLHPPSCSSLPMLLLDCVQKSLFLNCPNEVWQGGPECNKLREKLNNGCPFVTIS